MFTPLLVLLYQYLFLIVLRTNNPKAKMLLLIPTTYNRKRLPFCQTITQNQKITII